MGLYDYRNQLYKDKKIYTRDEDEELNEIMRKAQERDEKLRNIELKNINRDREIQSKVSLPSLPEFKPKETKVTPIKISEPKPKKTNYLVNSGSDYTRYSNQKKPITTPNKEKLDNSLGGKIANKLINNPVTNNVVKPAAYGLMNAYATNVGMPLAQLSKDDTSIQKVLDIQNMYKDTKDNNLMSQIAGFGGDMAGNMSIYAPAMELSGLSALTSKLGSGVASKLGGSSLAKVGGSAVGEGIENALLSAVTQLPALSNGYTKGTDYAKNVGNEALAGALFGGVLRGATEGGSKLLNKINDSKLDLTNIKGESTNTLQNTLRDDLKTIETESITNLPNLEILNTEPNSDVKIEAMRDIDKLVNETKKIDEVDIPTSKLGEVTSRNLDEIAASKLEGNKGLSRHITETMPKSDRISQELKDLNARYDIDYDKISDSEAREYAKQRVDIDENKAIADLLSLKDTEYTKKDIATAYELVDRLQAKGDLNSLQTASDISISATMGLTKGGQLVQAAKMLNQKTPAGMVVHANNVLSKANKELPKGSEKLKLTGDEVKQITDFMKKAEKLPDGDKKTVLLAQAHKVYQDKIPSSLMDKIDSFRYINMLFNPKTLIKNAGGNVINLGASNLRDIIGTSIDSLIAKKTGVKTTGLPNLKAEWEGIVDGVKKVKRDSDLDIDTSMSNREGTKRNNLKGVPILGKAEKMLGTALSFGDRPLYEATYKNFIENFMKRNNIADISQLPAEVLELANQEGLRATYQQKTALGDAFNYLKTRTKPGVANTIKAVFPFTQTPAAILETATDYTPLGILKGIDNTKKAITGKGVFSTKNTKEIVDRLSAQKKGVNQLASGILGTGAIALGSALAKNGLITSDLSSDKDTRELQKQTGLQPYAAKIGDTYNSLEFGQPAAMPLMIGADMSKNGLSASNIGTGLDSLFNNSFLSGFKSLGQALGYEGVPGAIKDIASNYASQLTPFGALSNQINKTIDPTMRDTDGDTFLQEQLNKAKSKYPILSQSLPQLTDTVGNDKVYNEGMSLPSAIFNNFFNPSTTTKYTPNSVEQNALDMYNRTGDTKQMPRTAPNSISVGKGKEYKLTAEDKRIYNEMMANSLSGASATVDDYYSAMQRTIDNFRKEMKRRHGL